MPLKGEGKHEKVRRSRPSPGIIASDSSATMDSKETVKWEDGMSYPLIKVEISSASHPFFTGKQRVLNTEGRIGWFKKKYGKK